MRRKPLLVIAVIIAAALATGAAYLFINSDSRNPAHSAEAEKKAIEILRQKSGYATQKEITSGLGFSVGYDSEVLKPEGIVRHDSDQEGRFEGETYTGEEAQTKRDYVIVNLAFKDPGGEKIADGGSNGIERRAPVKPYMSIATSRHENYFAVLGDKVTDKDKLDTITKIKVRTLRETYPNDIIEQSSVRVGNIAYDVVHQVHRFKGMDSGLVHSSDSYYYLTVQNDRPYWVTITSTVLGASSSAEYLRSVIAGIRYHDEGKPLAENGELKRTSADTATAANSSDNRSNIRGQVSDSAMINIVARNQIATVRVGSSNCAPISYSARGYNFKISRACSGAIGSGSIISSDGIVATNGHVVYLPDSALIDQAWPTDDREWRAYFEFITRAGFTTLANVNQLVNRSKTGDEKATTELLSYLKRVPSSGISVGAREHTFVIQTSDSPIRQNKEMTGWSQNQTNIPATLIDYEFDDQQTEKINIPTLRHSDVALLRMKGSFPAVQLSSLAGVGSGDEITTIGYPAIVDNGANTKQSKTVPTVTQGSVTGLFRDAGSNRLINISAQIAPGNSGGPAFDTGGRQIGINTYTSGSKCAECFGYAVTRDAADITKLATKNNARLSTDGEVSWLWGQGMSRFIAGNYSGASQSFDELNRKYPGNYLVASFLAEARAQPQDAPSKSKDFENDPIQELPDYNFTDDGYGTPRAYSDYDGGVKGVLALVLGLLSIIIVNVAAVIVIIVVVARNRHRQYQQTGIQPPYPPQPNTPMPAAPLPGQPYVQPQPSPAPPPVPTVQSQPAVSAPYPQSPPSPQPPSPPPLVD